MTKPTLPSLDSMLFEPLLAIPKTMQPMFCSDDVPKVDPNTPFPFRTAGEELDYLASLGVTCKKVSLKDALHFFNTNNGDALWHALQGNFTKDPNTDAYIDVDVYDLMRLATIDQLLRQTLLLLCRNIEFSSKVHLVQVLQRMEPNQKDIVNDFITYLNASTVHKGMLMQDVKMNTNSVFAKPLYGPYITKKGIVNCPVTDFVNMLSFTVYIIFFDYCAMRTENDELIRLSPLMSMAKNMRHICAHNHYILTDLTSSFGADEYPQDALDEALSYMGIKQGLRDPIRSNRLTASTTAILYIHKYYVTEPAIVEQALSNLTLLKHESHLIPLSSTVIRFGYTFIYKAKFTIIMKEMLFTSED